MNDTRLEKLAPLSGFITVVLMMAGAALFGVYDYLPPADKLTEILSDNPTRVYIAGYLGSISAFFLIWFAGSVFNTTRKQEGGNGWLSLVSFGGGVASSVTLTAGFTAILATGARIGAEGGIAPIEAVTIYDLYSQIIGQMFAITMAVFIGATATLSLRMGIFPSWFGWASVLIALGLLTPIAYIFLALVLVWLLVVSIWLYNKAR